MCRLLLFLNYDFLIKETFFELSERQKKLYKFHIDLLIALCDIQGIFGNFWELLGKDV